MELMNQVPEWQSEPRKSSQLQIQEDPSSGARLAALQEAPSRITNSPSPSPGLSRPLQVSPPPYQGISRPLQAPPLPQTSEQVRQADTHSRSADCTSQGERDRRPVQTKLASQPLPKFGFVRIRCQVKGRQHRTRPLQGLQTASSPGLSRPPPGLSRSLSRS